jgi:hypothetical protein
MTKSCSSRGRRRVWGEQLHLKPHAGAAMEVITEFVNNPNISAADSAKRMGDAVEAQK